MKYLPLILLKRTQRLYRFTGILFLVTILFACNQPMEKNELKFDDYPVYEGKDLGLTATGKNWSLKIWAPTASKARLYLYREQFEKIASKTLNMNKSENGVWKVDITEAFTGWYYTMQVEINGKWQKEVVDPYTMLAGVNGLRGYIEDIKTISPPGWEADRVVMLNNKTDAVIYELHIRDLSMHESSGIINKGKFLGFTEENTVSPEGELTGLAHLKELGITHVHLLPIFDFRSIDETKLEENKFNWGYDPQNYNIPEGSYASDPNDPKARILELKSLIMMLHKQGIGVIMDVVYNHTGWTEEHPFNQLVPGYYYRQDADGDFSNASACGNETASERPMVRKFIRESMQFWAKEFRLDGFRVDLMGIHDIETMNLVSQDILNINPHALIYGEGWTAGPTPLPQEELAIKQNTFKLDHIAAFSDDFRDGIKGHWAEKADRGFVSGKKGMKQSLHFGLVGATDHPQVNYDEVNYSKTPWARDPWQSVNYVSCHDDLTLFDKLSLSAPEADEMQLIHMHTLANTMVFLAQGIPFLHGGVDFLRSKGGNHNSYESPDSVNSIDWSRKSKYREVFEYYQNLISLRKSHPAFRMMTTDLVKSHLELIDTGDELLVAFELKDYANGDDWKTIRVYFNGDTVKKPVKLPNAIWRIALSDGLFTMDNGPKAGKQIEIPRKRALIVYEE